MAGEVCAECDLQFEMRRGVAQVRAEEQVLVLEEDERGQVVLAPYEPGSGQDPAAGQGQRGTGPAQRPDRRVRGNRWADRREHVAVRAAERTGERATERAAPRPRPRQRIRQQQAWL